MKKDLRKGSGWTVAHVTDSQHGDMVARLDEAADSPANVANFPARVGVAVPVSIPADFTQLDPLEQQIREFIGAGDRGVLVAVISGTTPPLFRELICYVRSDFDVEQLRSLLQSRLPHLEIQSYIERDEAWDAYRSLKR